MSKPSILSLGHAGFAYRYAGHTILMDPWFYAGLLGTWFPKPDNGFLEADLLNTKFTQLYVSHTHEDHFDSLFLNKLDKDMEILCADFLSKELAHRLRRLGFTRITVLAHKQSHALSDQLSCTMYLSDPASAREDSGLLLRTDGGHTFLNTNDCSLNLADLPSQVDVLTCQYSGALHYPMCYDYAPEVMKARVKKYSSEIYQGLVRKVKHLSPAYYIPSAGPPCFLDPELAEFNAGDSHIFFDWPSVATAFDQDCPKTKAVPMNPGDKITCGPGGGLAVERTAVPYPSIEEFRLKRVSEWTFLARQNDVPPSEDAVEAYFADIKKRHAHVFALYPRQFSLRSGSAHWTIALDCATNRCVTPPAPTNYTFFVPPAILNLIIAGETDWEVAFATLKLKFSRKVDVFDSILIYTLYDADRPMLTQRMVDALKEKSAEMVTAHGFTYQRFCPHAKEDLSHAAVKDGILTCPRHFWRWDLATGQCIHGGTLPLKVKSPG